MGRFESVIRLSRTRGRLTGENELMFISDKDSLKFATRFILIVVPLLSSLFVTWSWIVEILLLFSVFVHTRSSGTKLTALSLGIGYAAAIISTGGNGIWQIGFTPWAGILLTMLKDKGMTTSVSVFWSLLLAAFLSALPVLPFISQLIVPENIQQSISSSLEFYQQQGTISALEKQGVSPADFEKYLRAALPVYYQLMPAIAGIIGMFELGIVYIIYRKTYRKFNHLRPFAIWRMPWYAVWVAIAGISGYLGGDYLGVNILKIIGMNLMAIMAFISLVLGFSCLAYLFKHPKVPRLVSLVIIFVGFFFSYFLLIGLLFTGLFDLVMNFRRIPEKIEGGQL